jgi:hypothetical protein
MFESKSRVSESEVLRRLESVEGRLTELAEQVAKLEHSQQAFSTVTREIAALKQEVEDFQQY